MTATVVDAGDGLCLTIPSLLGLHCVERANSVLFANEHARLTYGEAENVSRRIAKGLLAAGATKGTHIGLLIPNEPEFILAMLAAARIGAIVLPFSTLSTTAELKQLLTQSDTTMLIAAGAFRGRHFDELLAQAFPRLDYGTAGPLMLEDAPWLRRIWFAGDGSCAKGAEWTLEALQSCGEGITDDRLRATEATVRPADRFMMIHTSGSTGAPKAVIHQHGSLIRHLANCNEVRKLTPDDVLFGVSPWFWIAGFAFELVSTFVAGARLVGSNSQDASTVLDLIERERPTITNGYYPVVNWLAQHPSFAERDFSFLRRGNLFPIHAPDARPPDASYRHTLYGMSEAGSTVTICDEEYDLPERLRGAAGKLCAGFEGRIVDPDTGQDMPPGEIGELWLRGPFLMEGYYGKSRSEAFTPDGWWRSSDAVAIDEDGYVFLKGRLGNMIKSSFANVAPREVEAVMEQLTGRLSVVLGVPDSEKGEAVAGVVYTETGNEIDEDDLRARLREKLSGYKVPRHILEYRQEEMPTLSSGKIDMTRLKAIVIEACSARAG